MNNTLELLPSGEWPAPETMQQGLRDAALTDACVDLDVAGADRLDTTALQLLLAFVTSREGSGKPTLLLHVSPGLQKCFKEVGAQSLHALAHSCEAAQE